MESKTKIRRMYHVKGDSINEIIRKTGISRNTIRKIIRAEKVEYKYQREQQPSPQMGKHKEILESWLTNDFKLPRKQRRTATKYYKQLQSEHGYKGAYDSIQRFVKQWKAKKSQKASAYIPLTFEAGEAYQFDWSDETVEIAGIEQKIKVAHFRLCNSRKFFIVAYARESQEMLFDAHNKAFHFFGGLCRRGIYDNMKTAVSLVFIGKQRKFNDRFLALMDHYLIEPTACTPASGWEKGQVENQVDNIRGWLFSPRLKMATLAELNEYLQKECVRIAAERKHPEEKDKTIADMFAIEQSSLRELVAPFDGHKETTVSVTSTCLVNVDCNRYSVECAYANQVVTVKLYAEHIEVFSGQEKIAHHQRRFTKNKVYYNPWHYVPLLERKPGALRNGAPFKELKLPTTIAKVEAALMKRKGGDKDYVQILLAIKSHGIEVVDVACSIALGDNVVNKDAILNIIHRLRTGVKPEQIETPATLTLKQEPHADCEQYNKLLKEQK
tara:strand:+ start:143 stop:1636 length:1494 start_codon:yes stop_codon:yes gene_type:complete